MKFLVKTIGDFADVLFENELDVLALAAREHWKIDDEDGIVSQKGFDAIISKCSDFIDDICSKEYMAIDTYEFKTEYVIIVYMDDILNHFLETGKITICSGCTGVTYVNDMLFDNSFNAFCSEFCQIASRMNVVLA